MNKRMDLYTATLSGALTDLRGQVGRLGDGINWHIIHPRGAALTGIAENDASVLIEERAAGMYAALNQLVFQSGRSRWLSYINDDDVLFPCLVGMMKRHQVIDDERVIAFGRVRMVDEAGTDLYGFPTTDRMQDLEALWSEGIMPFTQQGMIFSRLVWETLGGFDQSYRYSGDLDFWVRAHLAGFTFKFYDLPVAAWRIRAGQLSANQSAVRAETARALLPIRAKYIPWLVRQRAKQRFRFRNFPQYLCRWKKMGRLRQASVFR